MVFLVTQTVSVVVNSNETSHTVGSFVNQETEVRNHEGEDVSIHLPTQFVEES